MFLSLTKWDIRRNIEQATQGDAPAACPPNHTFVPDWFRGRLIIWAHCSPASGNPGVRCTQTILARRDCWPPLVTDMERYVESCAECAVSTIPSKLPLSDGHTVVMVVVDRFLKSCRFLPLSAITTALQIAEALLTHVFLALWPARGFCIGPWTAVHLTSLLSNVLTTEHQRQSHLVSTLWYHPQSNGRAPSG